MPKSHPAALLAAALLFPFGASAEFSTERVITGLDQPIYVASPPGDSRLFVVQRGGKIRIWDGAQLLEPPFLDIEAKVNPAGEGGLLSIAFAPDYATSRAFYVYYTADGAVAGARSRAASRASARSRGVRTSPTPRRRCSCA